MSGTRLTTVMNSKKIMAKNEENRCVMRRKIHGGAPLRPRVAVIHGRRAPKAPHEEKRDQCENKWLRPEQLNAPPQQPPAIAMEPARRNQSIQNAEPNGYTLSISSKNS